MDITYYNRTEPVETMFLLKQAFLENFVVVVLDFASEKADVIINYL
jgi:hypothetical protein